MKDKQQLKYEKTAKRRRSGLVPALAICLLALGIGFASAVERTQTLRAGELQTESSAAYAQVKKQQTDVLVTRSATTARRSTTAATTKSAVADFFVMPVGGSIIKNFSLTQLQYSETLGDWRLHTALDIAANGDTPVHASGNGRVRTVYEDRQLGNVVEIDHGNDIVAFYCGLSRPTVKKDDVVQAGQTLGSIGNIPCESVERLHLHFAVQKNGEWVDPVKALGIGVD